MKLATASPKEREMGKCYFKACKINKKSSLAWGRPTKSEPAVGVAAVPPAGHSTVPLDSRAPEPQDQSLPLAGAPCWTPGAGIDTEVGGAGPGRKCLPRLKIVWERTGNRNCRPTGKCFLSYQETRTSVGGSHTLQQYYSSREASPWKELDGEAGVWVGLGGGS